MCKTPMSAIFWLHIAVKLFLSVESWYPNYEAM